MSFLAPKPFSGQSLNDVIRYLAEIARTFADLYTFLGKVKLKQAYVESVVDTYVSFSATATNEDVTTVTLDAGTWNIWGTVAFDPNGAGGTLQGEAWIGLKSRDDAQTRRGQSLIEVQLASVAVEQAAHVFRRITLADRATVYLGARATFSSGAVRRCGSIWAIGRG